MVPSPETFPFLIVGNKVDLEAEKRAVSKDLAEKFCAENGDITYLETSAKNNSNVE